MRRRECNCGQGRGARAWANFLRGEQEGVVLKGIGGGQRWQSVIGGGVRDGEAGGGREGKGGSRWELWMRHT